MLLAQLLVRSIERCYSEFTVSLPLFPSADTSLLYACAGMRHLWRNLCSTSTSWCTRIWSGSEEAHQEVPVELARFHDYCQFEMLTLIWLQPHWCMLCR